VAVIINKGALKVVIKIITKRLSRKLGGKDVKICQKIYIYKPVTTKGAPLVSPERIQTF